MPICNLLKEKNGTPLLVYIPRNDIYKWEETVVSVYIVSGKMLEKSTMTEKNIYFLFSSILCKLLYMYKSNIMFYMSFCFLECSLKMA